MSTIEITQDELDARIAEAVEGLRQKNEQLLGEVKKLKKGRDIDPGELQALESERDELRSKLTAAEKAAKIATKDAETIRKQLESESSFNQRLLVDNGLTEALTKNGVTNPVHLKAAKALLMQGIKVELDGENRVAKMGDKLLTEAITEWASGDEGKHFVAAPGNAGGGAAGGGAGNGGAGAAKGKLDGSPAERAAYFAGKYDFSAT
jgi:NurA-like 5'-3' nuclease